MLITKQSMFSGKYHTLDLPITQAQLDDYKNGAKAQNAFPQLNADQREFLMTGITAEEWAETFGTSNKSKNTQEV